MSPKLMPQAGLALFLKDTRSPNRPVVFTNGCFDLLHVGHVRYLTAARRLGGLLVVGLNSDDSVRRIKGPLRPIIGQAERAEVLCGLACVDFVTIFDEPDPLALIQAIQPDILVKGADWALQDIIGADAVISRGGRVERISIVPGASTSEIIERIIERYARR
ncbi:MULTISPECIES: D-glycero-beta-D-manno-heptose 1-phosphate adenylyltransferase [Desulfococcus]|uniref:D-glycero-beta-D-manno-heptose 1-phosphate adenylyltransferase n=1 Tax=Desulfococcus multivorans DSM 2059 TaxID=1121405 RepID=S7TPD5_DESML|nr:D-glycero-beta-D-manno-heptose 1-phosphate adenylyltransferase [Desulfococcus multivorans]AQV00072.1 D-glycero-beta-D-manno-heptose 1-phosphate adenylyltransferase [Desulfococcus multivorans]EPR38751.1 rfaE bifunctional protein [Desulfococcus multivorans DSM 2059]SJZ78493.1 rfaE bifunctional protein, domain II [Desulfococcus multivorans DSM 2059]